MKLPSITNATLTKVEGKAFTADYDRDATTSAAKWTGTEEVLWSETTEEVTTGNATNVIIRRSLVIDASIVIPWAVDDKVTATWEGDTVTGIAQKIVVTKATGLVGVIRVVLENG